MTDGKVLKGQRGRARVETLPKGDRVIDLDGMKFQIGLPIAEELLSALGSSLRPYAGYSIFDKIMGELDPVMDRLMAKDPAEDGRDPGRAEAFVMALAMIRNPYEPDYIAEKARQMERHNSRQEEV